MQGQSAFLGKMPEDLYVMGRCALNLVRNRKHPRFTFVSDFSPMYHRVIQTAVAVMLGDELLPVCGQIERQTAGVGVSVPESARSAGNRLIEVWSTRTVLWQPQYRRK